MGYNREKEIRKQSAAIITPIIQGLNKKVIEPDPYDESFIGRTEFIEEQEYLRHYLDSWIEASCNFTAWSKKNPELSNKINQYVIGYKCYLKAEKDGRAVLITQVTNNSVAGLINADVYAINSFLRVIRSPLFDAIGKCERCDKYYLNNSGHRNKKYCSRPCATRNTALNSVRAKRQEEQEEKIKKARKAIQEFKSLNPKATDWKVWVAKRAGVTSKWITQAFNRGDLPNAKSLVETK